MSIPSEALPPVESELLTATFSAAGETLFRDPAWCRAFGGGEDVWERIDEQDRETALRRLQEAATGSMVTNQFFPINAPGRDEPLPVFLNFIPVHVPEGSERTIEAITVTGELLVMSETAMRTQTQRDRMESLGRMTMGIAHDFNNLLGSILSHTEVVKNTYQGDVPAIMLGEYLRTIEQAALDGAALVQRIQQYIRREQVRFEPLDLPSLIEDCLQLTKPYWYNEPRRKGISIETALKTRGKVPPVMGAAAELREVLVNLILNALQAMPEGGQLTFDVHFERERGVVVDVVDTGIGMPEFVRRRIFEPLFTTKGEHGTGMGLAVSYGVIQKHEGSITVASEVGQGTCFSITIPPATVEEKESASEQAEQGTKKAYALAVDDEWQLRKALVKLLALKGHEARQAGSGPEALTLLEAEDDFSYNIVITDHGMPEMNGRQLAREIRRRFPDLRIILLTGDTEVGKADADVDVIMSKPFRIDDLEAVIQQLL
ncbi:MAG: hybrid sensor histidine kinase/response regulator [Rhodothermales bacterium]